MAIIRNRTFTKLIALALVFAMLAGTSGAAPANAAEIIHGAGGGGVSEYDTSNKATFSSWTAYLYISCPDLCGKETNAFRSVVSILGGPIGWILGAVTHNQLKEKCNGFGIVIPVKYFGPILNPVQSAASLLTAIKPQLGPERVVTFDANGGTITQAIGTSGGSAVGSITRTVRAGAEIGTLPKPVKTGYTFEGWFTTNASAGGQAVQSTTVMRNMDETFWARWSLTPGGEYEIDVYIYPGFNNAQRAEFKTESGGSEPVRIWSKNPLAGNASASAAILYSGSGARIGASLNSGTDEILYDITPGTVYYAGTWGSNAEVAYTIKSRAPLTLIRNGAPAPPSKVILTKENPTADINVGTGKGYRVPVELSVSAGDSAYIESSVPASAGFSAAAYSSTTAETASHSGGLDGNFTTPQFFGLASYSFYAGTKNDVAGSYTVTAHFETPLTGTAVVSGNAVYGNELTATLTGSNARGTLHYVWLRDDSEIEGANAETYTSTAEDVDKEISVMIFAEGNSGGLQSAPVTITEPSGVLRGIAEVKYSTLGLDWLEAGNRYIPTSLIGDVGSSNTIGPFEWTWERSDSTDFSGAVETITGTDARKYTDQDGIPGELDRYNYALSSDDVGKYLRVIISADGFTGTLVSEPVGPIADEVIPIRFTAEQIGGSPDIADSVGIKITFNSDDIKDDKGIQRLTTYIYAGEGADAGRAERGDLLRDGNNTFTLTLKSVTTQGNVRLEIVNMGYYKTESKSATVAVYKNLCGEGHSPGAAATCQHAQVCQSCGVTLADTGPHNFAKHTETPSANCQPGTETWICQDCQATDTRETKPAGEHSYGDWSVTTQPTATTAGEQTRTCSVCGAIDTMLIPATGGGGSIGGDDGITIPVTGITLNYDALSLITGDIASLTAIVTPSSATNTSVTWKSSDPNVATVDRKGQVTAVAPGSCTITATTIDGGMVATCTVTVSNPTAPAPTEIVIDLTGLGLDEGILKLKPGDEVNLSVTATPNGTTFTAEGLPGGLTLTPDGRLYGVVPEEGTYTVRVTATAPDGTQLTVTLVVEIREGEIIVTPEGGSGGCAAGLGMFALLSGVVLLSARRKK